MPLYEEIIALKQSLPMSEAQAQLFLDRLPPKIQEQIISAIYIGRDHINSTHINGMNTTEHIPKEEYACIINKKGIDIVKYLNALELCATNSNFNLNDL